MKLVELEVATGSRVRLFKFWCGFFCYCVGMWMSVLPYRSRESLVRASAAQVPTVFSRVTTWTHHCSKSTSGGTSLLNTCLSKKPTFLQLVKEIIIKTGHRGLCFKMHPNNFIQRFSPIFTRKVPCTREETYATLCEQCTRLVYNIGFKFSSSETVFCNQRGTVMLNLL